MFDHLPPFLTVEEAARVLRIGRSLFWGEARVAAVTAARSGGATFARA